MRVVVRFALVATVVATTLAVGLAPAEATPTPPAQCGPGASPETDIQGRVPRTDYENGRTAAGYRCNVEQVGHDGNTGGFRTYRYVDHAGHECAYYDTTLLVGTSLLLGPDAGVAVLDMTDPANPVRTATLITPAMLSPHESLNLNQERGLLAAVMGSPATAPGIVDVYDLTADCRYPQLRSTTPLGGAGHEATFSPDGRTFYVTATALPWLVALDLTNPSLPLPVWVSTEHMFHGMNVSDDGNRLYGANLNGPGGQSGLSILDVSQVQQRVPNPSVPEVSFFTWPNVSVPQTAIPVTIDDHPYLVEIDEYARGAGTAPEAPVGAGRIIDIADEAHPVVVSELRLAVNELENRVGAQQFDPGASTPAQGYAGHYCAVPQREEPGIVACSFIVSGLRIFDIRDPAAPSEIAYFNPPSRQLFGGQATSVAAQALPNLYSCRIVTARAIASAEPTPPPPGTADLLQYLPADGDTLSHWAMSAPTFVPERQEVWYSDGMYGFYALRLTNGVWEPTVGAPAIPTALPASPTAPPGGDGGLPATGAELPILWALGACAVALATRRFAARPFFG